jgi:CopG family transcriptional regulator / antitoxin EndoAI
MLRNTKLITISIMPELLERLDETAKEESRTRSELLREALRRYIAEKEWKRLQRYGQRQAAELGLKEQDVERLIDEYRNEQSSA